jgi:hypothetical protein
MDAAVATYNADLAPYGVNLVEVGADQADAASITISMADSTVIGGAADGVLGVTQMDGAITLVSGWNWYVGADPSAVGTNQYDFQTVVTHELGHSMGLGHSADTNSVMFPSLGTGQARRSLTSNDLTLIDDNGSGAHALMAASFAPGAQSKENGARSGGTARANLAPMAEFAGIAGTVEHWSVLADRALPSGWLAGPTWQGSVLPGTGLPSFAAYGSNAASVIAALDLLTEMSASRDYQNSGGSRELAGGDLSIGIGDGNWASDQRKAPLINNDSAYPRDGALIGLLGEWNQRNADGNTSVGPDAGVASHSWTGNCNPNVAALLDYGPSEIPSKFPMQEAIYMGQGDGVMASEGGDMAVED